MISLFTASRTEGGPLERVPLNDTVYELNGKRFRLCWVDMAYTLVPIKAGAGGPGVEDAPMIEVCSSGDVAYVPATGHFHPNKPPGTSFCALPAYWLIYRLERALGIDPDAWWPLTVNAWLSSALSVGLISALGCVLFFRLAREFAGGAEWPAILATLALAFGTTFFPFGTVLFDHNLTASFLVAAFYFIRCRETFSARGRWLELCAGLRRDHELRRGGRGRSSSGSTCCLLAASAAGLAAEPRLYASGVRRTVPPHLLLRLREFRLAV